jgi:hypothetical protein
MYRNHRQQLAHAMRSYRSGYHSIVYQYKDYNANRIQQKINQG